MAKHILENVFLDSSWHADTLFGFDTSRMASCFFCFYANAG